MPHHARRVVPFIVTSEAPDSVALASYSVKPPSIVRLVLAGQLAGKIAATAWKSDPAQCLTGVPGMHWIAAQQAVVIAHQLRNNASSYFRMANISGNATPPLNPAVNTLQRIPAWLAGRQASLAALRKVRNRNRQLGPLGPLRSRLRCRPDVKILSRCFVAFQPSNGRMPGSPDNLG